MLQVKSKNKNRSKYTNDNFVPIKSITNGMIILDNNERVTGIKIVPRNIFILDYGTQNAIIDNLKNVYNMIDYEFWIVAADRPVDINVYLSQLELLFNSTHDQVKRKLIMEDINKANMFMNNNVVDTEYFLLFKEKNNDIIMKRIRQLINSFANAGLNMCLVIIFHLGVAGVAIGTVISQFISSVLVLRCLYQSQTSYQLRFSKLKINVEYLEQIFQVGIPAGIQSTVINFSNVLLQSSVNSFGSIAMAGYTAANNIFGFLYVTVNAVTQACMSFTSQNYGVGKWKRMDRVLIDCLILSFIAMMILGNSAYFFGPKLLTIYTSNPKVIQCGMEILLYTTVTYFLCGFMDLFPGALRGMGRSGVPMILSIIGTVGTRIVWIFWIFPSHRSLDILFISYPVSWIITIILQVICYYFVRKQLYGKKIAQA